MGRASTAKTQVVYTNDQILNAATGHWGEVAHDVRPAEPYEIAVPDSDPIVVLPLTRRRRKALKAAQAAYLMVGAQLAEAQNDGNADQGTITRIQSTLEVAEMAYDDAVFGDVRERVYEVFDDLDEAYWDAMYQAIHDKVINRVELPEDRCSKCGREFEDAVTEDGEGKGESSSTSSTATG